MSRILSVSTLFLGLVAASAHATVIAIPLPGLLGTYPVDEQNTTRTVTFQLPDPPTIVRGASLRVSGTTEVGLILCDGKLYPWPTSLTAYMEDTPSHYWFADEGMPFTAGAFSWTAAFQAVPPSGSTWDFLLDGTAEINLWGEPSGFILICSPASPSPTLTVTEAVLIIDGDFPIATETSTWGRIKALYRD
jgi:hypothetical protein